MRMHLIDNPKKIWRHPIMGVYDLLSQPARWLRTLALVATVMLCGSCLHQVKRVLPALAPQSPRPLAPADHARVMAAARLDTTGPIPAYYLAGTPYEMGYQHGTLARKLIQDFRTAAYRYIATVAQTSFGLPEWFAQAFAKPGLLYLGTGYWDQFPAEYLEEARGLADGAGLHILEVVVLQAIWEIYLDHHCSEFVVANAMTADGSLIHGFNCDQPMDDLGFANPYLAMFFWQPQGRRRVASLNTAGSIGVFAGMNDAGISVAWDNTHVNAPGVLGKGSKPAVPYVLTLRRLLEHSTTLDEAVKLAIDSLPRHYADIIIIGSASEKTAVALETAGKSYALRPLQGGALWSTNNFMSEEMAPLEKSGQWSALSTSARRRKFPRYVSYGEVFAANAGAMTPQQALAALRDPYPREAHGLLYGRGKRRKTICRMVTTFSLIMAPGKGLIWGSDGSYPAPLGMFVAYDVHSLARRPTEDLPATGYAASRRCAQAYLAGNLAVARSELTAAIAVDGETLPLCVMRAVLLHADGATKQARAELVGVTQRWPSTPAAKVVAGWLAGTSKAAIPFPSAIDPALRLRGLSQQTAHSTADPTPRNAGQVAH